MDMYAEVFDQVPEDILVLVDRAALMILNPDEADDPEFSSLVHATRDVSRSVTDLLLHVARHAEMNPIDMLAAFAESIVCDEYLDSGKVLNAQEMLMTVLASIRADQIEGPEALLLDSE